MVFVYMLLSELLASYCNIPKTLDKEVIGLTLDSRQIEPGFLFFAFNDGLSYQKIAQQKGAIATLIEAQDPSQAIYQQGEMLIIPIVNLQYVMAELAAHFYGYPVQSLQIIGVTGTSGKTSCTQLIAQLFATQQIRCGIIGTLGYGFYGELSETGFTTPDALRLQFILSDLVKRGATVVAMEVSSHSIHQKRIQGIAFDVGIFTNLSQDHLDYHGDMQAYAAVKKSFFTDFPQKNIVLNLDDGHGAKWLTELKNKTTYTYTTENNSEASVYVEQLNLNLHGIQALIHTPWGGGSTTIPLIGEFNLSNILAALIAVKLSTTLSVATLIENLKFLKPVAGRMQLLGGENKPLIVVDYAHKPDALEKVLKTLRAHTKGKLICVFGCGGERDQGKRPLMAAIAENLADQVIVTNDNPRHEKAEEIADQIFGGFKYPERALRLLNRSHAIEKSIQCAKSGDCILIAGKGAEHYQQIGDEKIPFDDVLEVNRYLQQSAQKA